MRRPVRLSGVLLICAFFHSGGWAGDFRQAFEAALLNDASLKAARAELAAARQNLPLAQAGLRPNISLNLSDAKVDGTRSVDSAFGPAQGTPLDYRAPIQSLSLRMPLYNRELSTRVESARIQENYAQAVFLARQADLVDRLATAWLEREEALQRAPAARVDLNALLTQHEIAKTRLRLGEGTVPEVANAQSAVAFAEAQILDVQNQLQLARLVLKQISGIDLDVMPDSPTVTQSLPDKTLTKPTAFSVKPFLTEPLQRLLIKAEMDNPAIASRRYAVDIAQSVTTIRRAAHYPRLDFVASATDSRNESLGTLNQSATQQSIGLQFTLPIYSGGHTTAAVEQALAEQDKAQAELLVEQQAVAREVARHCFAISTGVSRISAGQEAIKSASLALQGSSKGLQSGFATRAEVAADQRKLAQAQLEQAKTINETLLSRIRLELKVGASADAVVALISDFLSARPIQN